MCVCVYVEVCFLCVCVCVCVWVCGCVGVCVTCVCVNTHKPTHYRSHRKTPSSSQADDIDGGPDLYGCEVLGKLLFTYEVNYLHERDVGPDLYGCEVRGKLLFTYEIILFMNGYEVTHTLTLSLSHTHTHTHSLTHTHTHHYRACLKERCIAIEGERCINVFKYRA